MDFNLFVSYFVISTLSFNMYVLLFLVQILFVPSYLLINETSKIEYLLDKHKKFRQNRCVHDKVNEEYLNLDNFADNTVKLSEKTERFGEDLKSYGSSACHSDKSRNNSVHYNQHIADGLLINSDVPDLHWLQYKRVYNKLYSNILHEKSAFSIWRNNLNRVAEHNRQYLAGEKSYSLHLNHFGDWHLTSYIKQLLKLIKTVPLFDPAEDHEKNAYRRNLHRRIPKKVDWRSEGFRPRREEQFHCGACYAFAVAHALQAQLYMKHENWRELSTQQIVDCSWRDGNLGCNGGSLQAAMRYVARDGLVMESYYPYIGKRGHCRHNRLAARVRARRWATLPKGDEDAIERAVATIGPLAVAVNAAPYTFQLYKSGIYDDPFCVPWNLNHAMLLVGYTPDYWILLNWWGKQWGEDGYMRIRRGFNICGVANMATYVEL